MSAPRTPAARRATTAPGLLAAFLGLAVIGAACAAADELRDPMRPPRGAQSAAAAPREAPPVLSAVMTFEGKRTAIFNGRLVRDGSVVGAYTIDSILEDGVRYRHASGTHELHLAHPGSTVKKPAAGPPRAPSGVLQ